MPQTSALVYCLRVAGPFAVTGAKPRSKLQTQREKQGEFYWSLSGYEQNPLSLLL